jgi:chromosome segregation ATPase
MIAEHLVWVVLMWLFLSSGLGFVLAWFIQHWRYAEARALGVALERETTELKDIQDELLEQLESAETALSSASAKNENKDYSHDKRFEELKSIIAKKQEEQASKARQMEMLQDALNDKTRDTDLALKDIQKLEFELSQQKASFNALRDELNGVQASLKESQQNVDTFRRDLIDTQKMLTLAEAKHLQQEAVIAEMSNKLSEANQENSLLMENVRGLQNHIAEREREINNTLESLPAMPNATQEEREIAFLRQQLSEANVRVLELEQATQHLQLALVSAKQEPRAAASVSNQAAQVRDTAVMITDDELVSYRLAAQRLQELEDSLSKAVLQAQERKTEVAGLKSRIQDLEATVAQMWKQPQYQTHTDLQASNETAA